MRIQLAGLQWGLLATAATFAVSRDGGSIEDTAFRGIELAQIRGRRDHKVQCAAVRQLLDFRTGFGVAGVDACQRRVGISAPGSKPPQAAATLGHRACRGMREAVGRPRPPFRPHVSPGLDFLTRNETINALTSIC